MPGLTNAYSTTLLDNAIHGKAAFSSPTLFIELHKAGTTPTDAGTTDEADYTGYAPVATLAAVYNAAVNGVCDNASDITFGENTGATTNTIRNFYRTDTSGGTKIDYGSFSGDVDITPGDTPVIRAGELSIDYNNN